MAAHPLVIIRALTLDDVDAWTGDPLHQQHLRDGLAESGDYLAAVTPEAQIVGKIGIQYDKQPGAGTLWQFDVVPGFRDQGIGTALTNEAERLIGTRGLDRVTLSVEDTNEAAIRLYRRLGYAEFGTEPAEWDQRAPDGTIHRYRCRCLMMEKELNPDSDSIMIHSRR